MVEGLTQNKGVNIKILSAVPLNRSMSSELYHKREREFEKGIEYNYLPFFNIPFLRHIWLLICGFFSVLTWCRKNRRGVVICDVLDISIATAALLASKINKITSVGIVTDVPILLAKMIGGKAWLSKIILITNTLLVNGFDSYVLLTEQMNELINKNKKTYVVIEGQVDIKMGTCKNELKTKYEKKICLYAGALYEIYGLKLLTDAFIAANVEGAELHIYGSGELEEHLKTICMQYTNIRYFGIVSNEIVVQEQLKATLLINPRPTHEEYTKYSFPSKNMEYMASGTPVLTTCLPGMPDEYMQYVYLIKDETIGGLTNTLKKVLLNTREELHQKGRNAKLFVLSNKNNVVQARKILDMITNSKGI